jgi:hypothetical protein
MEASDGSSKSYLSAGRLSERSEEFQIAFLCVPLSQRCLALLNMTIWT